MVPLIMCIGKYPCVSTSIGFQNCDDSVRPWRLGLGLFFGCLENINRNQFDGYAGKPEICERRRISECVQVDFMRD